MRTIYFVFLISFKGIHANQQMLCYKQNKPKKSNGTSNEDKESIWAKNRKKKETYEENGNPEKSHTFTKG